MAIVEITGWRPGFNKGACTKIVRAAFSLDLADGKNMTDAVLEGKIQRILVPSTEIAHRVAQELTAIGALATAIDGP